MRETTSACLPYTCVLVSCFPSSVIKSSSYSILGMLPFLSFIPHCCESPWRKDRNALRCTCWSICRPTWGVCMQISTGLDSQGSIYLYLIIRELQEKERAPPQSLQGANISFLFILNLFVQRSPFNAPYILSSGGKLEKKTGSSQLFQSQDVSGRLHHLIFGPLWSVFPVNILLRCAASVGIRDLHVFTLYLSASNKDVVLWSKSLIRFNLSRRIHIVHVITATNNDSL